MQRGCLKQQTHKRGPDVWQFRWSENSLDGKRLHHKKIIGTVEQYPDETAARRAVGGLVSEINTGVRPMNSGVMTVAQLCDHFAQRELANDNSWRSHATKKIYQAYLTRWIRPFWQKYELADVRTIQVESWLRGLNDGSHNARRRFFPVDDCHPCTLLVPSLAPTQGKGHYPRSVKQIYR
jgi:integrase